MMSYLHPWDAALCNSHGKGVTSRYIEQTTQIHHILLEFAKLCLTTISWRVKYSKKKINGKVYMKLIIAWGREVNSPYPR